jgi:flagellar hook-associated protein 3 FlgL
MRVTDSQFFANMKRNLAQRSSDYAHAQQVATSGLKVGQPSDDPIAFAEARDQTTNLTRAQSYQRTIDQAKPSLDTADAALGDIDTTLGRIRDIAVQGANDTLSSTDRLTLSNELNGLRDQLVALGNSQAGDSYVFGGYKNGTPPFDATGTYTGDTTAQSVEVSRGVNLAVGVTGDRVFGTPGTDVFSTITKLQTALTTGTSTNISSTITDIDTNLEAVRTAHSEIGVHLNSLDLAGAIAGRASDLAQTNHANLVEADAAGAYTDLAHMQSALSAAIQIAAQLPPPGLVERQR